MDPAPLTITNRAIDEIRPNPRNSRTHTNHQVRQIADSIAAFGFVNPCLINPIDQIIAGDGRLRAAKLLGMKYVPTIRLDNLTEDQIRAYVIADNRLAEICGWNKSILAIELQHLMTLDCADLDVTITGFEVAEIDAVIEEANGESAVEDPAPEPALDQPPVTEPGDVWLLDKHRIICGNSIQEDTYLALMGSRRATMAFSDPPYNVPIHGHASGNGSIRHREFAMASGEMSELEYVSFQNNFQRLQAKYSTSSSLHYICSDWRHVAELIAVGKQNYQEFANLCVWTKDCPGMGSFYRSAYELVAIFRKGKGPHRNNVQLGRFGRNRTNVWAYPGIQTLSRQSEEGNLLALHPTVKPIAMVADAILDCTARGEVVLDSFLGSGTTLMAAQRVGRVCYGIEIDPLYVDVAIRRWQNHTGEAAVHASTGKRFAEVAAQRQVNHA